MPNTHYNRGRAAEYRAITTMKRYGFSCVRAASSHGVYDVVGVRFDSVVLVQVKQGERPSPSDYKTLIALEVPENTCKVALWYAPNDPVARVLYSNPEALPQWFGFARWLPEVPKQKAFRLPTPKESSSI